MVISKVIADEVIQEMNREKNLKYETETRKLFRANINLSAIIFLCDNIMVISKVIADEVIQEMNREKNLKYDYRVNESM